MGGFKARNGLQLAVLRPDGLQMQMCDTKFESSLEKVGLTMAGSFSGPSRILSGPNIKWSGPSRAPSGPYCNGRVLLGPLRVLIAMVRSFSGAFGSLLQWSGPFDSSSGRVLV